MLRKYGIKRELEDLEDYESHYNSNQEAKTAQSDDDNDDSYKHFVNEREKQFYQGGADMDFVRYHKRVTRNFHVQLQEILDTSKQTVIKGIQNQYKICLNYIRLNRSCTVVNIWWTLQVLPPELVPQEYRNLQMVQEQEYIEQEMSFRAKEIERQKSDLEKGLLPPETELMKQLTAEEILIQRDQ